MIRDLPLLAPDAALAAVLGRQRSVLLMQRCASCKRFRFYPQPCCPHCRSFESEWVETSGRGRIRSWIVAHGPVMSAFQEKVPIAVVLVELEEDPELRLVDNIRGCANEELRFDIAVEVLFERVADDVVLPQWRPRG